MVLSQGGNCHRDIDAQSSGQKGCRGDSGEKITSNAPFAYFIFLWLTSKAREFVASMTVCADIIGSLAWALYISIRICGLSVAT